MIRKFNNNLKLSQRKRVFLILLLIPVSLLCKVFQYSVLSEKYFIDSNKIKILMEGYGIDRGTSYMFTANFFKAINVFNFTTLLEWSFMITIIFIVIICFMLNKYKTITINDFIFIYFSVIILSIFGFNLSKEVIQLLFFFTIYSVLISNSKRRTKIILINLVLAIETILFREYYILLLLIFNISVVVFYFFRFKNITSKIIIIFLLLYLCFFVSSIIFPKYYYQIVTVREITERSLLGTNTLIKNIFGNSKTFFIFVLNYTCNFIRIMLPIEIINKGVIQLLFFIYQTYLSILLFKALKNKDINHNLLVIFLLSYQIASTAFEPDFGSVIRHGSTLFFMYIDMKIRDKDKYKYEEKIHEQ